ncbi:hypothetical protein [Ruminiclostridium herbifermentans]|nr:hypothetical protein [Ruminiclostridium herbifermentans]
MYSFDLKGNVLIINNSGLFSENEATSFMAEYSQIVKTIDTKKTTLILNATELKVLPQKMIPLLEKCTELYMKDDFKNIFLIEFSSLITNSQINRVAKTLGFDQRYKMFKTVEEALKAAK